MVDTPPVTEMIITLNIEQGFPVHVKDNNGKIYEPTVLASEALMPPAGGFREVGNLKWTRSSPTCLVLNIIGGGQYVICTG
jgi:hypothetical protein